METPCERRYKTLCRHFFTSVSGTGVPLISDHFHCQLFVPLLKVKHCSRHVFLFHPLSNFPCLLLPDPSLISIPSVFSGEYLHCKVVSGLNSLPPSVRPPSRKVRLSFRSWFRCSTLTRTHITVVPVTPTFVSLPTFLTEIFPSISDLVFLGLRCILLSYFPSQP